MGVDRPKSGPLVDVVSVVVNGAVEVVIGGDDAGGAAVEAAPVSSPSGAVEAGLDMAGPAVDVDVSRLVSRMPVTTAAARIRAAKTPASRPTTRRRLVCGGSGCACRGPGIGNGGAAIVAEAAGLNSVAIPLWAHVASVLAKSWHRANRWRRSFASATSNARSRPASSGRMVAMRGGDAVRWRLMRTAGFESWNGGIPVKR